MNRAEVIAVLIASFNRRDKTVKCIQNVLAQKLPPSATVKVYLFDDASSDDTASSVSTLFPEVIQLMGDGQSYWSGGMRKAFEYALQYDHEYYLWLNDDVELYDSAIKRLLEVAKSRTGAVVGSCRAYAARTITYGGLVQKVWGNKLSLKRVEPSVDAVRSAQTFNGNIVLLPKCVVKKVGVISDRFTHGMGDIDYGFRVVNAGFPISVIPGFAGLCDANAEHDSRDKNIPFRGRLRALLGPKGLPVAEWLYLTKTHMPFTWWVPFLLAYMRLLFPK